MTIRYLDQEFYEPGFDYNFQRPLQLSNCFRFSSSERKKENHTCTVVILFSLVQAVCDILQS